MGFTFLAFAERERLQARRRKETTPERDARLDDQRDRAQARRRETTPERDARIVYIIYGQTYYWICSLERAPPTVRCAVSLFQLLFCAFLGCAKCND